MAYKSGNTTQSTGVTKRVDTTQNASVTELFPALVINTNYRCSSVENLRKFIDSINFTSPQVKKTFVNTSNAEAAIRVVENLDTMPASFYRDKMLNAIGISQYLKVLDKSNPIKKVVWGYREKPAGIPDNHAGDIFVFFKSNKKLGISLKAGTTKSKEPLLNTYVATTYKKLGKESELKKLEGELWTKVYSKVPGVKDVASKANYMTKKSEVTSLYVVYYVHHQEKADKLYNEMLLVSRQQICKVINSLSLKEFKSWVNDNFNLQTNQVDVPLILVKAVGKNAEQKNDDLASRIASVTKFNAYLNPNSVQGWFIDIMAPNSKKRLIMTIRSDAGVREEKKPGQQGRLGKYTMLKLQYSGIE